MISKKDAMEFPFLKESSNLAKEMGIKSTLDDSIETPEVCSFVDEYLTEVYYNRFATHKAVEDFWMARARFLISCVVISQLGKERAFHRFAEYESRYFVQKVEHKDKEMFPVYFDMVWGEVWGRPFHIEKTKDGNFWAVRVPEFLQFKRKIDRNSEYALVNQTVVGGYVIISKETLLYILQVGLEHLLYERCKKLFSGIPVRHIDGDNVIGTKYKRGVVLPPKLVELVKKFQYVDLHTSIYKSPPDKDISEYNTEKLIQKVVKLKGTIPPCMAYLMRKFRRCEHVPHFERFALMTFMLAREDPESEILGLFEKASNYKKDEIDYLLKHTKKTGYKTPNCDKMDDNRICFRNSVCGGCKNPLQLIG